ncbi:MAG: hypothetical protein JW864_13870 [Spirochaetes bacterium]|nr:hypothetical protein [Spirochaetota bacterium]
MKIVYFTSGITGSGRIVRGISIGNALKRKHVSCEYTIISSSQFGHLACDFRHIELPVEEDTAHLKDTYQQSILYKTIAELDPDILVIDLLWFPLYHFLDCFKFKKIFLHSQAGDNYFDITIAGDRRLFRLEDYDRIVRCEPLPATLEAEEINPLVIRNKNEILDRDEAVQKLGVKSNGPLCLFAFNGKPGEFEEIKNKYSYLEDAGYTMLYSTNYSCKSFFPVADYFNAFDFIISGAGYNSFWEMIYFDKDGVFIPVKRQFENQYWRIQNCQEYYFEENGADQLVDIIVNL